MARAFWILGLVVLAGVAVLFAGRGRDVVDVERAASDLAPSAPAQALPAADSESATPAPSAREAERDEHAAVPEDGAFDPCAVYGRVVDSDEHPIEGARVLLFGRAGSRDGHLLARTLADADGRFRFDGLQARATFKLYADAPHFANAELTTNGGHDQLVMLARLDLLRGKVLDATTRQPLGDVVLRSGIDGPWSDDGRLPAPETVSAADGSYELECVLDGATYYVNARRPGCAEERFAGEVESTGGVDLFLSCPEPPGELVFEAYDFANGEPLAGRRVTGGGGELVTDDRGRFSIPRVGTFSFLSLRVPGSCETHVEDPYAEGVIRVPIVFGGALRVRVLDSAGRAVPQADVVFPGRTWQTATRIPGLPEGFGVRSCQRIPLTDADGTTLVQGILPSERAYRPYASHPELGRSPFGRVTIASASDREELELVLRAGATLHGVVTDRSLPKQTRLSLVDERFHDRAERALHVRRTWTDDRGGYRFEGVPHGAYSLVDDNEGRGVEVQVWRDDVEQDLHFRTHMSSITGRVLDHLGRPAPGVRVFARAEGGELLTRSNVEAGPGGAFTLEVEAPPDVTYTVVAAHGLQSDQIEGVFPGAEVELTLERLHTVPFRALDAHTGAPLSEFDLWWAERGSTGFTERDPDDGPTDDDGLRGYTFPEGELDVFLASPELGFLPSEILALDVGPETEPVEVALESGTRVSFRVVESGEDAKRAIRRLGRGSTRLLLTEELADPDVLARYPKWMRWFRGQRELVLRPGSYHFRGAPNGVRLTPSSFTVPPVESVEVAVEVALEPD